MTPDDAIELLELARAYSPSLPMTKGTPAVWAHALADVSPADATAAVHAHFAVSGPWVTTADIRRRVADRRGLLPPDPETAYAQAVAFKNWLDRRTGPEPPIHPATLETARKIKWSAFDAPPGIAHRQFIDAYRPTAEKAAEQALTGNMAELAAAVEAPKALPAGCGVTPEPEPEPDVSEVRIAEVHTAVARASVKRALTPVRPDYAPPTDIEKERWKTALRGWAETEGHPIHVEEAS